MIMLKKIIFLENMNPPNWRTPSFFRGVAQPGLLSILGVAVTLTKGVRSQRRWVYSDGCTHELPQTAPPK